MSNTCPECGAVWQDDLTCQEHFHQLLAWEADYPEKTYGVHHLLVLCYLLQHPHLYSPQGLQEAKKLLAAFVEQGTPPQEVRRRQRGKVDSSQRAWKITGTPTSYGAYAHPIRWPLTVVDMTAGGVDGYMSNVQRWARTMYEALKAAGDAR